MLDHHTPCQSNTADLVAGCISGDRGSWDAIVQRFSPLVYTIARRQGLDAEAASDVTQSTFLELWRGITTIRGPEHLAAWLGTVARRHVARLRVKLPCGSELSEEADTPDPRDLVAEWERAATVNQALAQLDEPCRRLIYLLFLDPAQPKQVDIATLLGRARGGIGPMRGRCLDKLRAVLEAVDG